MDAEKIRAAAVAEPEPDEDEGTQPEPETEHEPEPESEGEPEPEPEPVQPPSDAEAEKAWATAEKASTSYGKKIANTLDTHAPQLAECPLCLSNLRGYIDTNDAGRIPEHVKDVVHAFFGDTAEAEYVASVTMRECGECRGLGKVLTGSKVPNYITLTCAGCKGHGFIPPPGAPQNGVAQLDTAPVPVLAGQHEPVRDDADAWGSPRLLDTGLENPNYGRMPQYKDPSLP